MIYLLATIPLLLSVINFFYPSKKRFIVFFNLWWGFWLLISSLNIVDFYQVSVNLYFYIVAGIVCINIGYFLSISLGLQVKRRVVLPPYNLFLLFELLYFSILSYLFFRLISIVDIYNNYWMVRFYFFGLELDGEPVSLFSSPVYANVFFIIRSFGFVSFIVSLPFFFVYGKKTLLMLSILNMSIYCLVSGGRDIIYYIVVFCFYVFYSGFYKRSFIYIVGMIVFVLFMSYLRQGGLDKTVYAFISYFTGSIVFFDIHVSNTDAFSYGGLILSTVFSPFFSILNLPNESLVVGADLMHFAMISDDSPYYNFYNAHPTMFFYFYKDFGYFISIPFILFFGFILGLVVSSLDHKNSFNLSVLSYISFAAIWGIFRIELLVFNSLFILFFSLLFIGYFKVRSGF